MIANLADGAGGFSYLFGCLDSELVLLYNTLKIPGDEIEQNPLSSYIPALTGCLSIKKRTLGLELLEEGVSNLLDRRFLAQLKTAYQGTIDIVTCDAEAVSPLPSKRVQLVQNLLLLARDYAVTTLIIKNYTRDLQVLVCNIQMGFLFFKKVHLLRSQFSGSTNSEVYLVMEHPHPPGSIEAPLLPGVFFGASLDYKSLAQHIRDWTEDWDTCPEEDLLQDAVAVTLQLLERGRPQGINHSPNTIADIIIHLDVGTRWQETHMRLLSKELLTPMTKVSIKSEKPRIIVSSRVILRLTTQWLISLALFGNMRDYELERYITTGAMIIYRTINDKIGTLLLESVPKNSRLTAPDRIIKLSSLRSAL